MVFVTIVTMFFFPHHDHVMLRIPWCVASASRHGLIGIDELSDPFTLRDAGVEPYREGCQDFQLGTNLASGNE